MWRALKYTKYIFMCISTYNFRGMEMASIQQNGSYIPYMRCCIFPDSHEAFFNYADS